VPEIKIDGYICSRCNHVWAPRDEAKPVVCPKCKSPYWNRPTSSGERKYSCKNCGKPFEAHPPDDKLKIALLKPCKEGDSIEIKYECENCFYKNSIFWDRKHVGGRVLKTR